MRTIYLLLLAACSPHLGEDQAELGWGTDGGVVNPQTYEYCKTVTVSGKVYYNDLRTAGRFTLRSKDGTTGSAKPYGTGNDKNYLGLLDANVRLYEIDNSYGGGLGCLASENLGSTRVLEDGSWSWTGNVCDHCNTEATENDTTLAIAASVSLERCDSNRCFRVATPDAGSATDHFADDWSGDTRARWYRGATSSVPHLVYNSVTSVDLGTDYYQASSSQTAGDPTDLDAKAANVFASLVDVTRKLHTELGVTFDQSEVSAYFPGTNHTHSHEPGFLCVGDPGTTEWLAGDEPAHEYGHLVHFTRWANQGKWVDYCYDGDGNGTITDAECQEKSSVAKWANTAFKEGWAEFVAAVTFDHTGASVGCDRRESDTPLGCAAGTVCALGRHYTPDVTDVLCDLWDSAQDCNGTQCDTIALSMPAMVDGVAAVWDRATDPDKKSYRDADEDHPTHTALGICEFVEALEAAGTSRTALFNTLAVTGLNCQL